MSLAMAGNISNGYTLTKSLRFRSSASAYLNRTFGTPTLSTKWTWSGWFKLGAITSSNKTIFDGGSPDTRISYEGTAQGPGQIVISNDTTTFLLTSPIYRDYSSWYHLVVAFDSSQGTASNRLRLYINGSEVTAFATDNRSSISGAIGINTATAHGIGRQPSGGSAYFDGYLTEVNFIDGQQLTPSSFGSTNAATGVWQPAKYTGTYGANGFYLPFIDNSTTTSSITGNTGIGRDFSGNGNYWTTNNISLATGTYSSLTSGSGNYTVPAGVTSLSYLVVAGGGGGYSGGGGAGGLLFGTMAVTPGQTIAYSVGGGGTGGNYLSSIPATNGTDTTFGALTATGGGAGTSAGNNGNTGGSGSGGAGSGSGTTTGGAGTSGQGFAGGGNVGFIASPYPSGGGGGAGAIGSNAASSSTSGAGGAGLAWVNGTTYAGGGGGGTFSAGNPAGAGGSGGGGGGGSTGNGTAGTPNTGGGGGGSPSAYIGGAGGSGVIIVGYGSSVTYDSMTDVPTLTNPTTANYCVLNSLSKASASSITNGNLNGTTTTASEQGIYSTLGVSSGKWYFESIPSSITSGGCMIGIAPSTTQGDSGSPGLTVTSGYGYYTTGSKYHGSGASYGNTFTTSDVIGCAVDLDNGKIWWSKNGTWQASGDPVAGTNAAYTGVSGTFVAGVGNGGVTSASTVSCNFGQQGFAYTPPTGFVALNTYNLPTSTIVKGNTVMNALTWTGTGTSSGRAFTGLGFKPDLVWGKPRSLAYSHSLSDSVRGASNRLQSQSTAAEQANFTYGYTSSFDSDGFTTTAGSTDNENWNQTSETFVAWCWQAGQGTNTTNTNGSITSTVSVNATAGFSVVTYTGTGSNATVGHGLGVAPKMYIVKRRDSGVGNTNWLVYNAYLNGGVNPAQYYLMLQSTNGQGGATAIWNDIAPTSSVFSVGTSSETNGSGGTFVAYCWSEIAGFSKFGSYTGNGSSDGTFVYTGFRPKYIMIKMYSGSNSWALYDTTRQTYNGAVALLLAEAVDTEYTTTYLVDILSNGFKFRATNGIINASGSTYIYACFAENPFKNALAR
jgi:hypothetical protein